MKLRYLFTFFSLLFITINDAQTKQDKVLFSVGDEPVYVSEFLRVYNKNLDLVQDESQRNIDSYLELFTSYKLKLKEAKSLGFHEKESYLRELETYKEQLANSYMKDPQVTEDLLKESYDRMSYDIKASHILIKLPENANANDTLVAYNKLVELRERALNEGFEKVRSEVHDGKTVFGEQLGYFSGFKMVYKFETAAFNTPVGEVSMPFRTRFGYHIVNVIDKRKSKGERTVAHIMTMKKQGDTLYNPEERIQELYSKLQQGEAFDDLAKQFSDDKMSASKGGQLAPFSLGQLRAEKFEEAAFTLENNGDVSEPIQSAYGWHIIKLIDKTPVPSFVDMRHELEEKLKRDDRSKLIDEAFYKKLNEDYKITQNQQAVDYFVSILNDDYFKKQWELPSDFKAEESLFSINDQLFTFENFGTYLLEKQKGRIYKRPLKEFVAEQYNNYLNKSLVAYKEAKLEEENEEYAHILTEYKDGLLLFDLMENTIWNVSETDSVEIVNYYENNKNQYVLPKRIDAVVASSAKQKTLKKVSKLLDSDMELEEIKGLVNAKDKINVIFTSGIMDSESQMLPKAFPFKKGVSDIYKHNGSFVVAKVKEVLPETQRTFEEVKGKVISDYQTYKENVWVEELQNKYKVQINKDVLEVIKSQEKN